MKRDIYEDKMIDTLRLLLDIREKLARVKQTIEDYGYDCESAPEVAEMQSLERKLFNRVSEWEKP